MLATADGGRAALKEFLFRLLAQRRNVALLVLQRWLCVPQCACNHSSWFAASLGKNVRICLVARHETDEMETME